MHVEVHAVDAGAGIVLDAQVNVLLKVGWKFYATYQPLRGLSYSKNPVPFGGIEIELTWLEMSIFRRKKLFEICPICRAALFVAPDLLDEKKIFSPSTSWASLEKSQWTKRTSSSLRIESMNWFRKKNALQFLSETTSQPSIKAIRASVMPKPKLPLRAKFFLRSSYSLTFKPFSKISSQQRLGGPPTEIFVQQTEEFRSTICSILKQSTKGNFNLISN